MKKSIVVIGAVFVAMPADAHWQFTRWGMTPAQVVAQSKATLERVDPSSDTEMPYGTKEVSGTYDSSGRTLKASFWFKAGKLNRVNLSSEDEDTCFSLRRDLVSVYGNAASRSGGMIATNVWSDRSKGNRVQFSNWGTGGCSVIYSPLATGASSGL
jgi:hypothetical protein